MTRQIKEKEESVEREQNILDKVKEIIGRSK